VIEDEVVAGLGYERRAAVGQGGGQAAAVRDRKVAVGLPVPEQHGDRDVARGETPRARRSSLISRATSSPASASAASAAMTSATSGRSTTRRSHSGSWPLTWCRNRSGCRPSRRASKTSSH
jgi:hypothetical protein